MQCYTTWMLRMGGGGVGLVGLDLVNIGTTLYCCQFLSLNSLYVLFKPAKIIRYSDLFFFIDSLFRSPLYKSCIFLYFILQYYSTLFYYIVLFLSVYVYFWVLMFLGSSKMVKTTANLEQWSWIFFQSLLGFGSYKLSNGIPFGSWLQPLVWGFINVTSFVFYVT